MFEFTRSISIGLLLLTAGCQADRLDSRFSETVVERRSEAKEEALPDLMRMLSSGKLSKQQVREITDTALTIQGDANRTWSGAWGNWIESAKAQGTLSDAEFKEYAEQSASEWEFRAYRALDKNTGRFGLGYSLNHVGGRVASIYRPQGLELSYKIVEVSMARIPVTDPAASQGGGKWSFTSATGHGSSWFRTPEEIPGMETLKSGKYQATMILEEDIYESKRPDRILQRNRIELKDEFEYYKNLYSPRNRKQVDAQSPGGDVQ